MSPILTNSFYKTLNYDFSTTPFLFSDKFSHENHNGTQDLRTSDFRNSTFTQPVTLSYLLETNQTDVSFGILYFLTSRAEISNALLPFSDELFFVYFLQPNHTHSSTPFKGNFSRGVILSYLFVLTFATLVLCFSTDLQTQHNSVQKYFHLLSWAFGTFCQQCVSFKTCRKWQALYTISLTTFLTYFLYTIYCAIIIATLMKNQDTIRNLRQLFQHKYTFFAFKDTADVLLNGREVIQKIYIFKWLS